MEEEEKQTKTEDLTDPKGLKDIKDPKDPNDLKDPKDLKDPNDLKDTSDTEAAEEQPAEEQPAEAPPPEPDWKDRYARAMADFDNFRKRTARDREDLVKFAASDVLKDILPTVDNLARALEEAKDKADDPFVAGVKLVYDGLLKALADHGATPLDSAGEPFDANFHEALAQLPSEDVERGEARMDAEWQAPARRPSGGFSRKEGLTWLTSATTTRSWAYPRRQARTR